MELTTNHLDPVMLVRKNREGGRSVIQDLLLRRRWGLYENPR